MYPFIAIDGFVLYSFVLDAISCMSFCTFFCIRGCSFPRNTRNSFVCLCVCVCMRVVFCILFIYLHSFHIQNTLFPNSIQKTPPKIFIEISLQCFALKHGYNIYRGKMWIDISTARIYWCIYIVSLTQHKIDTHLTGDHLVWYNVI